MRNRIADDLKREIKKSGRDPVEYMLAVMENDQDPNRRLEAAKGAAPYIRAKLSQAEITHRDSLSEKTPEELEQLLANFFSSETDLVAKLATATTEQLEKTRAAFARLGLAIVPADGQVTHIDAASAK